MCAGGGVGGTSVHKGAEKAQSTNLLGPLHSSTVSPFYTCSLKHFSCLWITLGVGHREKR